MKKVFQSIVEIGRGDCWRATTASLFELELIQVPNFILFDNIKENKLLIGNKNKYGGITSFGIYWCFLNSIGWDYEGLGRLSTHELKYEDSVDGYFDASVPSKTFENISHAVIIDMNGLVVHDPNPNQAWLGINVKESGDLVYWHLLSKLKETK